MYVTRLGKRLPGKARRTAFVLLYTLLPFLVSRLVRKLRGQNENSKSWLSQTLASYPKLLDTIMNVHVALFYFQGLFYSLSKRFLGLRYAFAHNKDPEKLMRTGNYSFLGAIMLVQFAIKLVLKVNSRTAVETFDEQESSFFVYSSVKQLENVQTYVDSNSKVGRRVNTELLDPTQLPYIPEVSRSCMLCLSPMTNPAAANCGHIFCWTCIVDWIRDHPECPLCRQLCLEQNLLPLR